MRHTDGTLADTPAIDDELAELLLDNEVQRQIDWEMKAIQDGVDRYRRSLSDNLGDTRPGQIVQGEMLRRLVPAVAAAHDEALAKILNPARGERQHWWWLISFLKPEVLAMITVRSILTQSHTDRGEGRPFTQIAHQIGTAVEAQVEYESWRKAWKDKSKEDGYRDFAKILVLRAGGESAINRQTWDRWKKKLDEVTRLNWSRDAKVHVGAFLLGLAIEHCGGWFESRLVRLKGKTERRVMLSEDAQRAIMDINSRMETNRPYLRPTLIQPRRWEKRA